MTNERAKELVIRMFTTAALRAESFDYCMELNDAMQIACEALDKLSPKKPIAKHYEEAGEHPYVKYACPDCKTGISAVKENEKSYQNKFCHKCGQAIDWSDDDATD